MPYAWSFYALSESLDVVENRPGLEEALRAKLRVEISDTGRDASDGTRKAQLTQELEESSNVFIVFNDETLANPALLAYNGEKTAIETFLEWLKSSLGLIVTPIVLDPGSMLEVADAFTDKNQLYDTKLLFDIDTEAKNLSKMEIEIDRVSLQALSQINERVYSEGLKSYLYKETGMRLALLPLSWISLAGTARIGRSKITTVRADVRDSVLQAVLQSAQYQV